MKSLILVLVLLNITFVFASDNVEVKEQATISGDFTSVDMCFNGDINEALNLVRDIYNEDTYGKYSQLPIEKNVFIQDNEIHANIYGSWVDYFYTEKISSCTK